MSEAELQRQLDEHAARIEMLEDTVSALLSAFKVGPMLYISSISWSKKPTVDI
jgi:hypothetical protein